MILPEKVTDDKRRSQMFMDACDRIRAAFGMTTSEELYLIGRIFEVIKFEMQENEKWHKKTSYEPDLDVQADTEIKAAVE